MAWDIYGNTLRRGYCEVHPSVPEEYPCYICMQEIEREERWRTERAIKDDLVRQHHEQQLKEAHEEEELQIIADNFQMFKKFLKPSL